MFGDKRAMDEGWALRAQQEIEDSNRNTYQSALNRAKEDYKNADWLTKLTSGITEDNYLKRHGFTDDMNKLGNAGQIGSNDFWDYKTGVERQLTADMEKGTGAVDFLNNVPVIGGILNYLTAPVAQLAGAARSIGTDKWNDRDHLSDLAALGQVGMNALTAGIGVPAGSLGAKVAYGAGTGAAMNALDVLREQGGETNGGDLLSSAAIGGAFGAAFPLAGAGLNKIKQRGINAIANKVSPVIGDDALDFARLAGKGTQYGAGLRDLGMSAANRFGNMSKFGKVATVGGLAGAGFGLKNLLSGNNNTYDDIKLAGAYMSDEDLANYLYSNYGIDYYNTGGY